MRWAPPLFEGVGYNHLIVNRGKKSLTLNLKSDKGKEIILKLARQADVVVESFRPGVMDRLGLGYEALKKVNPRLVYCAISGFGQTGPYSNRPGHDINYISYAGVLGNTGIEGGPPVIPGVQIADLGGALMALAGILMALVGREKNQCGKMVDISMTDTSFMLGVTAASKYAVSGQNPLLGGERLTGGVACYHVYSTRDYRFISIGALEPKFWAALCRALEREDLIPEQNAPSARQKEMIKILQEIFATRTLDEWIQVLSPVDTCFSPVLTMEEAFKDPHLCSREMILDLEYPGSGKYIQMGLPIKIKESPGNATSVAPGLGDQNTEILTKIGYSPEEISVFQANGII